MYIHFNFYFFLDKFLFIFIFLLFNHPPSPEQCRRASPSPLLSQKSLLQHFRSLKTNCCYLDLIKEQYWATRLGFEQFPPK